MKETEKKVTELSQKVYFWSFMEFDGCNLHVIIQGTFGAIKNCNIKKLCHLIRFRSRVLEEENYSKIRMLKLFASQRNSTAVLLRACLPAAVSWHPRNTQILKDWRRSMSDDCFQDKTKPSHTVS